MKLSRSIAAAALIVFALTACHHAQQKRPVVDPQLAKLTKEQAFQKGEEQYAKKKYQKARTYFSYIFENFPNDPFGRRALLRVADSYFAQKDAVNLVEAQYKYRDFINRYPGSDRADYAMLQIAMVSYQQMERPDRDQQKTNEALEKFDEMLRAYPSSKLRPEAEARRQDVLDRLAKHEHIVARFYMKRKANNAAILPPATDSQYHARAGIRCASSAPIGTGGARRSVPAVRGPARLGIRARNGDVRRLSRASKRSRGG